MLQHASLTTRRLLPQREPPGTQPQHLTAYDMLAAQQLMPLYQRLLSLRRTSRIPPLLQRRMSNVEGGSQDSAFRI
jgi:hypothetical protein